MNKKMIMNTTIIFVIFNLFSFSFDFPFFFFLLLDSNQVPSFVRTLLSFVETSIVIVMDRLRRNEKLSIPYFFFFIFEDRKGVSLNFSR